MKKNKLFLLPITLLLSGFILLSVSTTFGEAEIELQLKVLSLKEALAPFQFKDYLVLTYKPQVPVRVISARFAHEDYLKLYTYLKNENGVYFLLYPIPVNMKSLKYRVVIDGLWMIDPTNPLSEYDFYSNISFSVFPVEKVVEELIKNPKIISPRVVLFSLRDESGANFAIMGSFNHWDPFISRFSEDSPGKYSCNLHLAPGRYYYLLVKNGKVMTDPYNPLVVFDIHGEEQNYFDLR